MLVVSRKNGESVVIHNNIFVTVLEIKGNQIRLGFEAPDEVPVNRSEIWVKIQKEKKRVFTEIELEQMPFQVHEALKCA